MATHGRSGLGRSVLGSVTDWVIREAQVPVVAIHPRMGITKHETWPGDDAATSELIALFDREGALSTRAVETLITRGPEAVPELLEATTAPKPAVRRHAAKALGKIRDERTVQPLVELLRDRAWDVSWEAGESLIRFGDEGMKAVLEDVVKAPADQRYNLAVAHVLEGAPLHLIHYMQPVLHALHSPEHSVTVPIAASKALQEIARQKMTA
jgi:hypothetical protein